MARPVVRPGDVFDEISVFGLFCGEKTESGLFRGLASVILNTFVSKSGKPIKVIKPQAEAPVNFFIEF